MGSLANNKYRFFSGIGVLSAVDALGMKGRLVQTAGAVDRNALATSTVKQEVIIQPIRVLGTNVNKEAFNHQWGFNPLRA